METNQKRKETYGFEKTKTVYETEQRNESASAEGCWVGAWSTTPVRFDPKEFLGLKYGKFQTGLPCLTFRTELKPTIGGRDIRITFSNVFGKQPLTVDAVTLGKGTGSSVCKVRKETLRQVTFGGSRSVTIAPGETFTSDPIGMTVNALESIIISSYVKKSGVMRTFGMIGGHTYAQFGNHVNATGMIGSPMKLNGDFGEYAIIPLISCVEVCASEASAAVLIGDSTIANDIPLMLAEKLHKAGIHNVSILQQAVKGNRLMDNGVGRLGMVYGESMLERFDRDALDLPGVNRIFIKVGDNDIIHPQCKTMQGKAKYVTADEMIEAYSALIEKAHKRNIKVYMFTRTAWRGYTRNLLGGGDDVTWTSEIDEMRKCLNRWICSSQCPAGGFVDLDYLCSDNLAEEMKKEYTTDGIHFSPEGQKLVVEKMSLDYFR